MTEQENGYCIWDLSREKWWKTRGYGYTSELLIAGTFSKESASKICGGPFSGEIMFLKSNLMLSESLVKKIHDGHFDIKSK